MLYEDAKTTWTVKVCKIIALKAVMTGLGLFFHIFFGVQAYESQSRMDVSFLFGSGLSNPKP